MVRRVGKKIVEVRAGEGGLGLLRIAVAGGYNSTSLCGFGIILGERLYIRIFGFSNHKIKLDLRLGTADANGITYL